MPIPAVQLLLGLANGPLDDNSTWTVDAPGVTPQPGHWSDLSGYSDMVHIQRGRQQITGKFDAGTVDIHVRNKNGEFNTWGQSGLFTPYLDVMRQVKVRVAVGGVVFERFTGHLNTVRPLWPDVKMKEAELQAADLFRMLNNTKVGTSTFENWMVARSAYWPLNDLPGATTGAARAGGVALSAAGGTAGGSVAIFGGPALALANPNEASVYLGPYVATTFSGTGSATTYATGQPYLTTTSAGPSGSAWAVGAWVQVDPGAGPAVVLSQTAQVAQGAAHAYPSFLLNASGFCETRDNANGYHNSFNLGLGGFNLADGLPHRLVLNYVSNTLQIWVDGVSIFQMATGTMSMSTAIQFWIGATADGDGINAQGGMRVANVWVQRGAYLTSAQIVQDYAWAVGYAAQTVDRRIAGICATVGVPAAWLNLDAAVQNAAPNTVNIVSAFALPLLQTAEETEEGALYMTGRGQVRFISRQALATRSPYATVQCVFGDRVTPPAAIPGATWGQVGAWGQARWGALATAGWGVGGAWGSSAWGSGDIPIQPGAELGKDDIDLVTQPDVTRVGGLVQSIPSSGPAGPRSLSRSGMLHQTDVCSAAHAKWLLDKYSTIATRMRSFTVRLTELLNDPAALQRVLSLDLMHRIQIVRDEDGFNQVGNVEHIDETITPDEWTIAFQTSTADTYPTWSWADTQ